MTIASRVLFILQFLDNDCQYWLSNTILLSPYYPANYDNDNFCVWNITAKENYEILLEFDNFDVSKTGGH